MKSFKTSQLRVGDRFANIGGTLSSITRFNEGYILTVKLNGKESKIIAGRNRSWILFNR